MKKLLLIIICAFALVYGIVENSSAKSLLVSGKHHYICPTYTTGFEVGWDYMTLELKAAFNNNVDVTLFLEDWNQIVNYDALWIDARDNDVHPDCEPRWLSPIEIDNIKKFIGLGRRVVMVGEHDGWSIWNRQIISTVGGSYNALSIFNGLTVPITTNDLTIGVASVRYIGEAFSTGGGTALFDQNFAILWGDNVLIVLDTDLWANHRWGSADNSQFGINVANWIAGSFSTVAEIIQLLDTSIADGTIEGYGPGNSATGKLNTFRKMLETAGDMIDSGNIYGACKKLETVYSKCDGENKPLDFIMGAVDADPDPVSKLADMINSLMISLECE